VVEAEVELYAPVKRFLEAQGFVVKGEVGRCDLVAVRGDEAPVVVELKRRFSLELVLQGVDRLAITDAVYVAVPEPGRRRSGTSPHEPAVHRLCRRLGLGLMTVDPRGPVQVIVEPVPYRPRKDRPRLTRLLGEHARRVGDPNRGGSTRVPLVTAYRQDALRVARLIAHSGEASVAALRRAGAPKDAAAILQRDVYGWFERVRRGTYRLTPKGEQGLRDFPAP
jgi:hypothetical protein